MKKPFIVAASIAVLGMGVAAMTGLFMLINTAGQKPLPEPAALSSEKSSDSALTTPPETTQNPAKDPGSQQPPAPMCPAFISSWFPQAETLENGCSTPGSAHYDIAVNGVSFRALFGFAILGPNYSTQAWDTFADTDPSTSFGLALGASETYEDGTLRDFQPLSLGDHGVRGRIVANLYDKDSNPRQQVNAVYRVRYNTCVADLLISGIGPANSSSYGYQVFAAAEQKIRDHVDIMKQFTACKQ